MFLVISLVPGTVASSKRSINARTRWVKVEFGIPRGRSGGDVQVIDCWMCETAPQEGKGPSSTVPPSSSRSEAVSTGSPGWRKSVFQSPRKQGLLGLVDSCSVPSSAQLSSGVQLRSLDGAAGQLSLTGRLGSPVGRLWVGAWGPNKRLLP